MRPIRTKTIPERVEDLEDEVRGDPNNPDDKGLVGNVHDLLDLQTERDGLIRPARVIALLLGIAIACLTLIEAVRRLGGS